MNVGGLKDIGLIRMGWRICGRGERVAVVLAMIILVSSSHEAKSLLRQLLIPCTSPSS